MAELSIDSVREEAELAAYLGADFDRRLLEGHAQEMEREFAESGDDKAFYRKSHAYLYDLTAFAMMATKVPYRATITSHVPPPARLLDYGCGVGSDGLLLAENGYSVAFADFDNPSATYLRWRLEHRGIEAEVFDLDCGDLPGGFDLAYSFDVIEHVDDPLAFLAEMESRADRVLVNFLEPEPDDISLHHDLDVGKLVRHARDKGLIIYQRHHDRSHVVLYATDGSVTRSSSWRAYLAGRIRIAFGRA